MLATSKYINNFIIGNTIGEIIIKINSEPVFENEKFFTQFLTRDDKIGIIASDADFLKRFVNQVVNVTNIDVDYDTHMENQLNQNLCVVRGTHVKVHDTRRNPSKLTGYVFDDFVEAEADGKIYKVVKIEIANNETKIVFIDPKIKLYQKLRRGYKVEFSGKARNYEGLDIIMITHKYNLIYIGKRDDPDDKMNGLPDIKEERITKDNQPPQKNKSYSGRSSNNKTKQTPTTQMKPIPPYQQKAISSTQQQYSAPPLNHMQPQIPPNQMMYLVPVNQGSPPIPLNRASFNGMPVPPYANQPILMTQLPMHQMQMLQQQMYQNGNGNLQGPSRPHQPQERRS